MVSTVHMPGGHALHAEYPAYFEAEIGAPPRRARHPGALLAARPGDKLSDILAKVAAQDAAFAVSVSPPHAQAPYDPKKGNPAVHFRLMGDAERIARVEFASLPAAVPVDRLRIGMTVDAMRAVRADLKRINTLDRTEVIWGSPGPVGERPDDARYQTWVRFRDGVIAEIWLTDDAWGDEIRQYSQALYDQKKAAAAPARAALHAARLEEQARLNGSQTLADVEKLLDGWAAEDDTFPRGGAGEPAARLAAWLRGASPDEWHAMAADWNWDNGDEPLIWIARQPDCDKATALLIYWGFDPSFFAARHFMPPADGSHWDMQAAAAVVHIAARWRAGFYRRAEIAWTDVPRKPNLAQLGVDDSMARPLPGRVIEARFDGGHPVAPFIE
jgi:hypothetical protein